MKQKVEKKKVAPIKILMGLFVPFILLTIFFSVLLNDATVDVGMGATDGKYASVLSGIDGIVEANPRLVDIAMLASHDAVTDKLSPDSPMDYHDRPTVLGKLDPITGGFQYRFGKTQAVGLDVQLRQGARMFHIKYTDYEGTWYATHAHLSDTIEAYVMQVLHYLASPEAKGEIVILLWHPMYFGEGVTLDTFHHWLAGVKLDGKNLYNYVHYGATNTFDEEGKPGVRIGDLRYNDLTLNGTAPGVVMFDRREGTRFYEDGMEGTFTDEYMGKFFDMDANATHVWHSRIGQDTLIEKINVQAKIVEESDHWDNKLRMNQTQASFSAGGFSDIFIDIGAWSLLRFAKDYNVTLVNHENFDYWLSVMPVFQVDFVNSNHGDFNNLVNQKIIAYNTALVNSILNA